MSVDQRVFVDTNILVYAHDQTAEDKNRRAAAALRQLWRDRNGCLSIQVFQEFFVTATRKLPRPVTSQDAAEIISTLAAWKVHSPTADDVLEAIRLQARYPLSFWDAMVIISAKALGCAVVWSEDLNTGQSYDGVVIVNPLIAEVDKSSG